MKRTAMPNKKITFLLIFVCFPVWAMDDDKNGKKRSDEQLALEFFDNTAFSSFAKRNKLTSKLSDFYHGFNDHDMAHQPEDVKNAHRDAFIRGATRAAIEIGIKSLGMPTASGLQLVSAASGTGLKKKLEKYDASASCAPAADAFYAMYTGCTCKESFDNIKLVLRAGEKLNATKRKVANFISAGLIAGADKIKLTEENITRLATFVHTSINQTAPNYIKESYAAFLRKKKKKNQEKKEPDTNRKKTEKLQRQKALLDQCRQSSHEEMSTFVTQMLQEQQKEFFEQAKIFTDKSRQKNNASVSLSNDQWKKAINTTVDGFNGVAAIATIFGKRREAYAIATFGSAAAQAVSSIQTFAQIGPMCGISPYVGILSAVASVATLFQEDDGQDNTQAILDAITHGIMHLSQQMHRFHEDMREQFELVHKKLNNHHLIMLEQFFALAQDQATVRQKLKSLGQYVKENQKAIQDGIDSLHKTVGDNFRMTVDNLNGLRIEEIDDLVERSLLTLQRKDVALEEFSRCLEELYVKAISRASADALTGSAVDIHSSTALATVLESAPNQQNIFAHPAFSHINLLSRYIESNFQGFRHEKLVNPLIWIKCVDAILHMLTQKLEHDIAYPATEHARDLDIQKLLLLKKQGEKIIAFAEQLGHNKYLELLVARYQLRLQELADAIEREQKSFEEKETQNLRREHSAFIESEKAKTKRVATSYDCKKCVAHITDAIANSKAQHTYNSMLWPYYQSADWQALGYFRGQLSVSIHLEDSKSMTPEEVRNPSKFFEHLHQRYTETMESRDAKLLEATQVNLKNSFDSIGTSISRWLYPDNQDSNLPILMMPLQNLPLNPIYIVAENRGLGSISHEYSVIDKTVHIQSYFNAKDTTQKIKILHMAKECSFENMYTLSENILHIWYGGRYPKSSDTYSTPGLQLKKGSPSFAAFLNYYPPIDPYPAERENFVSNARKEPDQSQVFASSIQKQMQDIQEEKRVELNREVLAQVAARVPTSAIFKAAQEFNVYFKILDSLLTFMYHDLMQDNQHPLCKQLVALKSDNDPHYMKDMAALTKYLQNYSAQHNREHRQGNYLPFYLRSTTEKITRVINEIIGSECKPQFNSVMRVINSIDALISHYRMRTIRPRVLLLKEADEKDKKIEALLESNKELAAETRMVKQELAQVKEQLQAVMNLLLEMKKQTPIK